MRENVLRVCQNVCKTAALAIEAVTSAMAGNPNRAKTKKCTENGSKLIQNGSAGERATVTLAVAGNRNRPKSEKVYCAIVKMYAKRERWR